MQDGLVSGLSLAGDQPGEDAAVFIAVGTTDEESPVINEVCFLSKDCACD